MKPPFALPFLVLIICSCTHTKPDSLVKEPTISQIYFHTVCQDSCSYVHVLMLSEFEEAKFNDYNFVYIGDKYLDSVKTSLPVAAIEFCKPFEFIDIGGSENDEQIKAHAIASLWYEPTVQGDKVPEISHVSIWTNGQRKGFDYLQVKSRRQAMEYYRSKN